MWEIESNFLQMHSLLWLSTRRFGEKGDPARMSWSQIRVDEFWRLSHRWLNAGHHGLIWKWYY